MGKHVFSSRMIYERENQLMEALTECAGEYYDINFTQNEIIGTPIQIVDGVKYPMFEKLGLSPDISYSEFIDYWEAKVIPNELEAFREFFSIDNVKRRYAQGERVICHKYWTNDVCGNPMYANHIIRLYEDVETGDLLGLCYITDVKEREILIQKDASVQELYKLAEDKVSFLEYMSANVPGGYHRCGTTDGFKLQFVTRSFLDVVGWTKEELAEELDNNYIELVAPEDREFFMSHEPILREKGRVDLVYRIRRRDGTRRWIQDATIQTEMENGEVCFQCTLSDITEYVEKLNAEKERAEASSLAKSTFLFNASHDIRTPMNAIQGFARIIQENVDDPEKVKNAVDKILQSSNTLMTLINDVLELSRIERGKDDVNERPMDMTAHIQKLYEMFAFEMEQAGLEFYMENDVEHPQVLGDDLKLTRIAMNLLSNAKKFTPSGGKVTFGIKESQYDGACAVYTLFVKDTGIGMSKDFQRKAFEQFERERSATESGVSGSGLGLAIIEKYCEMLGGTCEINSELGKGSEFRVAIGLKIRDENAQKSTVLPTSIDFTNKRILLVEDNDFNREIARYILEGVELQVDEAENGSICVDKLLRAKPGYYDLVLMDIQMPIMDGYTATREIRNIQNPEIANIPILAMTANAFEEDKQKCLAVGMNGHLAKPLDIEILMAELKKFFQDK